MPHAGRRHASGRRRLRELRVRGVSGFPNQLIFYRPIRGGIEAVRVLHAARDFDQALRGPWT